MRLIAAVLQGKVDLDLDLDVALGIVGATYSFDAPWIGGTYTIGAAIPFGYANLKVELGAGSARADSFHIADAEREEPTA